MIVRTFGDVVEYDPGPRFWARHVAGLLLLSLGSFVRSRGLGWVIPGGVRYRCFPQDRCHFVEPDVSFVRLDRLPPEWVTGDEDPSLAPDLAVEVISRKTLAADLEQSIGDCGRARVPLLWVVNPDTHSVRVHRPDGTSRLLSKDEELVGEEILSEFRCPVRDLFLVPCSAKLMHQSESPAEKKG